MTGMNIDGTLTPPIHTQSATTLDLPRHEEILSEAVAPSNANILSVGLLTDLIGLHFRVIDFKKSLSPDRVQRGENGLGGFRETSKILSQKK